MADGTAATAHGGNSARTRSKRRAFIEIAIAYVLIMTVIWSPRPAQRYLWILAVAALATMTCLSWDGLKAMGLRRKNFFRSLWVVGLALVLAAAALGVARELHTVHVHHGLLHVVKTYWAYVVWTFVQQFLMQCFFLLRFLRLLNDEKAAAFATAGLFALAHLPNPILTPVTLIWGFAACLIFLRYRNLYPLGMAHAIFGITIAITVPATMVHNMRVGLGYLTYSPTHRHAPLMQPQGPDGIH